MSPISAGSIIVVNSPTPGSAVNAVTCGAAFARGWISRSSPSMVGAHASMNARLSAITRRDTAGSDSSASHCRPGPVQ
jgi:hypothetical protein